MIRKELSELFLRLGSDSRGEGIQSHIRWNASQTFLGGIIMSYGNPFNRLLKNIKGSFINRELFSASKPQYDDDVIECMQFGICSTNPHRLKDIPYFHF